MNKAKHNIFKTNELQYVGKKTRAHDSPCVKSEKLLYMSLGFEFILSVSICVYVSRIRYLGLCMFVSKCE